MAICKAPYIEYIHSFFDNVEKTFIENYFGHAHRKSVEKMNISFICYYVDFNILNSIFFALNYVQSGLECSLNFMAMLFSFSSFSLSLMILILECYEMFSILMKPSFHDF